MKNSPNTCQKRETKLDIDAQNAEYPKGTKRGGKKNSSKKSKTQQDNEQRCHTCGLIRREQELHPGANPTEN